MKFAFVNENVIKKIEDHESRELIEDAHLYQVVIDITDLVYQPQVGWVFEKGKLFLYCKPITARQIRIALLLIGLSEEMIEAALDTLDEPTRSIAKIEWHKSTEFDRNDELVGMVGQMLGWNDEQLDQLWVTAATI